MATLIEDIKAIRKHKKISLNELYEKTKVPAHIIEMIDDGTIFSENPNNKTYIRTFIRTYVKGLGVSNEDIIQALDDHEVDVYDGYLAEKYISGADKDTPSGPPPSGGSTGPTAKNKSEAGDKAGKKSEKGREDSPKSSSSGRSKAQGASPASSSNDPDLDDEDDKIRQTKSTHTSGSQSLDLRPDITKPYNSRTPEPPSISSVDWADMVKRFNPLESHSRIYMTFASVMCVLLIIALVFYAFYRADSFPLNFNSWGTNGSTADLDEAVQLPVVSDTLPGDEPEDRPRPALADTLELVILATGDKLEPVRIRSDINNILAPYWVEEDEALSVEFVDQILIRGQYSRMTLIFNGHVIENFRSFTTQDQFVRISREYLDDDPRWKVTGPESLPPQVSSTSDMDEPVAE
ncbi:MAG: helix-turn-helix domain-containing protein [Balneolales bacterium]